MALNLWKTGGKATSFNPLPTTYSYGITSNSLLLPSSINVPNCNAILSFWASSPSSGIVHFNSSNVGKDFNLTPTRQLFTYILSDSHAYNHIDLYDKNGNGDIIIDSITLVQQPLPKLTINGVDGFLSGKWTFNPNAIILDDVTLRTNAHTAWSSSSSNSMSVISGNSYSFTAFVTSNGSAIAGLLLNWFDVNGSLINSGGTWSCYTTNASETFVSATLSAPTNAVTLKVIATSNDVGTFTVRQPMVNYGSIPAPYSKKTGDKMVMQTAKKNLIFTDPILAANTTGSGTTVLMTDETTHYYRTTAQSGVGGVSTYANPHEYSFASLVAGQRYTISCDVRIPTSGSVGFYGSRSFTNNVPANTWTRISATYVYSATDYRMIGHTFSGTQLDWRNFQIEQGTVATPYTSFAVQANKKPQRTNANGQSTVLPSPKGLSFNGVTDYIRLPMNCTPQLFTLTATFKTTSTITEAMIYAKNTNDGGVYNKVSIMSTGKLRFTISTTTGVFDLDSFGSSYNDGVKHTVVCKYDGINMYIYADGVLDRSVAKTGTVNYSNGTFPTIATSNSIPNTSVFKGTIYNINLNDDTLQQTIFNYDFTNPKNIVGTSVIPNAQNLIPSFEDASWTLNANAKVLGKDVLHFDPTGVFQENRVKINVSPNTNYLSVGKYSPGSYVEIWNDSLTTMIASVTNGFVSFNSGSNSVFRIKHGNTVVGSFDFIKPQLYQLSGKEGTINGSPRQLNKPNKRSLYAKR